MKSHTQNYLFLFLIIWVLAFLLFQKPQKEVIKVPAIVGNISPAPISYLEPKGEPLVIEWKHSTITSKNPVNDSLISIYRDSLGQIQNELEREKARFEFFVESTAKRTFTTTFENEYLIADIEGDVYGYLNRIEMPYFQIKEQEVKVPQPKMITFGLQAGYGMTFYGPSPYVGVGVNMDFEQAIRKLIKGF